MTRSLGQCDLSGATWQGDSTSVSTYKGSDDDCACDVDRVGLEVLDN